MKPSIAPQVLRFRAALSRAALQRHRVGCALPGRRRALRSARGQVRRRLDALALQHDRRLVESEKRCAAGVALRVAGASRPWARSVRRLGRRRVAATPRSWRLRFAATPRSWRRSFVGGGSRRRRGRGIVYRPGPRRDVVGELFAAARALDMRVGVHFELSEWLDEATLAKVRAAASRSRPCYVLHEDDARRYYRRAEHSVPSNPNGTETR